MCTCVKIETWRIAATKRSTAALRPLRTLTASWWR
jgi:hypothetical protein